MTNFFEFTVKDIKNQDWDLSALKNNASRLEAMSCSLCLSHTPNNRSFWLSTSRPSAVSPSNTLVWKNFTRNIRIVALLLLDAHATSLLVKVCSDTVYA